MLSNNDGINWLIHDDFALACDVVCIRYCRHKKHFNCQTDIHTFLLVSGSHKQIHIVIASVEVVNHTLPITLYMSIFSH